MTHSNHDEHVTSHISEHDDELTIDRRKRSFDTTINVAHILTTIGAIVAVFNWAADIKTTIATNITEIANLKDERMREAEELKDSIKELNQKVDRLIERGH